MPAPETGRRRKRLRASAFVALIAVGLFASWWLSRSQQVPPLPLHRHVPEAADRLVWIDALDSLDRPLAGLVGRVPGSEGLVSAVAWIAGLEGLDQARLEAVGVDTRSGLAIYRFDDAWWGVAGAHDERATRHFVSVLRRRGHDVEELGRHDDGQRRWRIGERGRPELTRGHLGRDGPLMWMRWRLSAGGGDGTAALQRWRTAKRTDKEKMGAASGLAHGRTLLDEDIGFHDVLRRLVGPAALLVGRQIDAFERATLDLAISDATVQAQVRLNTAPGASKRFADFHGRFLPAEQRHLDLGDLLPDEVMALVRARLNPDLLAMVPAVFRDRLLPKNLLASLDPALSTINARTLLFDVLDGQIAVGVLGVDDRLTWKPDGWPIAELRAAVHGFVAVGLKTEQAASALVGGCQASLKAASVAVESLTIGRFHGFAASSRETPPWILLYGGNSVVWISGRGELKRLQWAASDRFPTLAEATEQGVERDLVQGRRYWLGILTTTGRLARTLRRRGIPDHLVAMIASVAAIAAAVEIDDDGISVDLKVRPRQYRKGGQT